MSQSPSGTTVESPNRPLWKPILIAGLLGGLLGGIVSFAASRLVKPAPPPSPPVANQQAINEAREISQSLFAELKAGKIEQFMAHVRLAYPALTDEQFKEYRFRFANDRTEHMKLFGKSLDQFEYLRGAAETTDLVQLIYLEKFERGGVLWKFIMYRGPESWNLTYVEWNPSTAGAFSH
jgi:hypothetical protein